MQAFRVERSRSQVSLRLSGQSRDVSSNSSRCPKGYGAYRARVRYDERPGRHMERHYDTAGGRFPLLQPADRWRDRCGSVDHDFLRIGLAEQWHRNPRAGSGCKLLSREGCAARSRERAMVFSTITNKWRRCFVYTPPDYGTNVQGSYPVLYCSTVGAKMKPAGTPRATWISSWTT